MPPPGGRRNRHRRFPSRGRKPLEEEPFGERNRVRPRFSSCRFVGLRNCLFSMSAPVLRACSGVLLVAVALLGIGCGGENELGVAEGRYQLYIEGSLTDTLTGPAILRPQRNGRLGIELGSRDSSGLSLELTRSPRASGRYEVVGAELLDGPQADSLRGAIAFLSVADAQFAATQGRLSVTEVGEETIEGTLDMEMEERRNGPSGNRSVRVTGALRATRP